MTTTEPLAIDGGTPVRATPLPGHDRLMGQDELDELASVIRSGQLGRHGGSKVKELERAFAERYGVKHAIAVSSGSAADHTAIAMIDPEPGDEIITTPCTDFGTILGILFQNAIPVFADLDPQTLCLDPAFGRGEGHAADARDPGGASLRRSGRYRRAKGDRRPSWHSRHRGLRAGAARRAERPVGRNDRADRLLQLQQHQAPELRRRRHGHHQRRRPGAPRAALCRQGLAAGRGRALQPLPGPELPVERAGRRGGAGGSAPAGRERRSAPESRRIDLRAHRRGAWRSDSGRASGARSSYWILHLFVDDGIDAGEVAAGARSGRRSLLRSLRHAALHLAGAAGCKHLWTVAISRSILPTPTGRSTTRRDFVRSSRNAGNS